MKKSGVPRPVYRRLRAYAFDPGVSLDIDASFINEVTLHVPWEGDLPADETTEGPLNTEDRGLLPGPIGEYLEVIDVDPASGAWYEPVDLNDPALLAQDGHAPSEGNPQFHQQMVYAVAMLTIQHFERALGRRVTWRSYRESAKTGERDQWTPRLRLYPHALREANAYYSPQKRAILFGYFPAGLGASGIDRPIGRNLPGGMVFTCCSHDVIVHEMTHALLDGLHRRFLDASNFDVLAFHEAFADLVALFQHFTFPEVVRHQIASTRGDLSAQNMLGQLARQFGEATGNRGALRDAIGRVDRETGQWLPHEPDPHEYRTIYEPHHRGAILVAAVFDAFVQVYRRRTADLYRLSTGGSGVLPEGAIHPDLVDRLAREATKAAGHFLRICIRALDYCPPVDLTFGEYLRAMITADYDVIPDDPLGYRLALVDAFRRRGIYPPDVQSLSVDALLWKPPSMSLNMHRMNARLRAYGDAESQEVAEMLRTLGGDTWDLRRDRRKGWDHERKYCSALHKLLSRYLKRDAVSQEFIEELGLSVENVETTNLRTINHDQDGYPLVEVHAARPAWQLRKDGTLGLNLVIELTQKRRGYYEADEQRETDKGEREPRRADFWFRGGCTVLVDAGTGEIRYAIHKSITSEPRLRRQRDRQTSPPQVSLSETYFHADGKAEPFALLHANI